MGRRLALLLLVGMGAADAAGNPINRCEGSDGIQVFTDQSCAALGIAERARSTMPRRRVGAMPAPAASSLGSGCAARTPEGLRHAVLDAIDRRDFNALSGLYNFDGRSRQTAAGVVRRLERMAKRPALEVELIFAEENLAAELDAFFDALVAEPTALPTLRIVQPTSGSAGPLSIEIFNIARSAGCVWLGG